MSDLYIGIMVNCNCTVDIDSAAVLCPLTGCQPHGVGGCGVPDRTLDTGVSLSATLQKGDLAHRDERSLSTRD